MLGLVITLAAATAPLPPGNVTCGDGPAACELAEDAPAEPAYATPTVIDCRNELVPLVLSTLVGECDGTPRDASYRISRAADSEEIRQAVSAAPRERRAGVATCGGVPARAPGLQLQGGQAIALASTPSFVLPESEVLATDASFGPPSRFGDPPDRPPRV
jgi:hypothetical protein